MAHLLGIDQQVVARGAPNFMAAYIKLPSNLVFEEWEQLVDTPEDNTIVEVLKYGFPARYREPVSTPSSANHPSSKSVPTGLRHLHYQGAESWGHVGTIQVASIPAMVPLLTRPTKDSGIRKVIMDLS